jgi:4-amino-4-deoxy-L-arabinose transferase-like glycosyltransferase
MSWTDLKWLVLMAVVFLAWHVPLMYRTATGMDEDLYAVPGTTILRTGVPKIPYVPTRDRRTFYYGVDRAVYMLPPLSFYLQALVQTVLGDGTGPARTASALEALVAAWLVFELSLRWLGDRRGALWGALLYLFGRTAYFPATTARPDMAATLFGLLSVWFLVRDEGARRWRRLAASGVAGGLSVLCHPMGLVPCAQVGLKLLLGPGGARKRLLAAALFTITALAAFGTWGFLVALYPDLFWIQFHGNVLGRAGPGMSHTIFHPWPAFAFQARQFITRAHPAQAGLYAVGTVWALVQAVRSAQPRSREFLYHLMSSVVLLVLFMGVHPLLGYFAFPAAFLCIAAGGIAAAAARWAAQATGRPRVVSAAITLGLVLVLAPGSGLRTVLAHLRHARDPAYNAHQLARTMMADLDPNSLVAVDGWYVLDFYLAGRRVVDAHYLEFLPVDYDFLLVGPHGLLLSKVPPESLEVVRRYGDFRDEFAPTATLYRPLTHRPLRGPRPEAREQTAPVETLGSSRAVW